MQGLYHKFAAIWSGHVRFLPHCFFSQKTGLMEPARLLTQFPSSKEEADCVPTCEGERWSSPALRRMLRIRAAWSKTHRNPPKPTKTHQNSPACPPPWPLPPRRSGTPVTSQTRHGKRSLVAAGLSASVPLARALPAPFSSHIKCNLQGRRAVPAAGRSVLAGALGVACPSPLGSCSEWLFPSAEEHLGCSYYWKKNIIVFQTTGQINNLSSHLLLLLTATGP